MPILTVKVLNIDTGVGMSGAGVYLFEGGGGVEPPENAVYSGITDETGIAKFDVSGFFRVGVFRDGYEQLDGDPCKPPEEWRGTWACWGAVGVARDIEYSFYLRFVAEAPPIPLWKVGIVILAMFGSGVGAYYLTKGGGK